MAELGSSVDREEVAVGGTTGPMKSVADSALEEQVLHTCDRGRGGHQCCRGFPELERIGGSTRNWSGPAEEMLVDVPT